MDRKAKGYISVFLLIIIAIISLMIYSLYYKNLENIKIRENSIIEKQASYISEAYINYIFNENLKDNIEAVRDISLDFDIKHLSLNSLNLFPEFDFQKTINLMSSEKARVPSMSIISQVDYEGVKICKEGVVNIFNDIFYLEQEVISKSNLSENLEDDYNKLVNNFRNMDLVKSDIDLLQMNNNILIKHIIHFYLYNYDKIYDCNEIIFGYTAKDYINKSVADKKMFMLEGNNAFGLTCLNTKQINLKGIIVNKGIIDLNSNIVFDGIFVSDSGKLNTNGYNFVVNGIFIELGDGSYPSMKTFYNRDNINKYIGHLPWAYDIRLDIIKEIYDF